MAYGFPKNINEDIKEKIKNYWHATVYALLDDPFNLHNKKLRVMYF